MLRTIVTNLLSFVSVFDVAVKHVQLNWFFQPVIAKPGWK